MPADVGHLLAMVNTLPAGSVWSHPLIGGEGLDRPAAAEAPDAGTLLAADHLSRARATRSFQTLRQALELLLIDQDG